MKVSDYLKIEKRLLLGLDVIPPQMRIMFSNIINSQIKYAGENDLETNGEEIELLETMKEILNEHQDIGTGG